MENKENTFCDLCKQPFTNESDDWKELSEGSEIFYKSLKFGRVRGIVNISACNDSDFDYLSLARELTQRDILVTVSGCALQGIHKEEFNEMGAGLADICNHFDIPPVICSGIDEYNSEIIGFLKAIERYTNINKLPLAAVIQPEYYDQDEICSKLKSIYNDVFCMEKVYLNIAEIIEEDIHNKRLELEWCDRFYCSVDSYS